MDTATKQCPFCAETIQAAAIVCRYCGRDLPIQPTAPAAPRVVADAAGKPVCSACGGYVRSDATSCKHCGVTFGATQTAQGAAQRLVTPSGPRCSVCQASVAAGAAQCPSCKAVFLNAPAALPIEKKKTHPAIIAVSAIVAVICLTLAIIGSMNPSRGPAARAVAPAAAQTVTIDGYDATAGLTVDPVNVWDNYQTRTAVVARVHHGDRVTMLSRNGNGVEIQTSGGVRGWLSAAFIRELK